MGCLGFALPAGRQGISLDPFVGSARRATDSLHGIILK